MSCAIAIRDAEQYTEGVPELKELVAASKSRSKWVQRLVISSSATVSLIILSMLLITIYLLNQKKDQLQSSVAIQNESIQELMDTVRGASLSSLPAQERNAILDSATRSVEKLADMVKGYPEYEVRLISLFNGLSDLAYDAEDWARAQKTAKTAQSRAQPLGFL
jgi:hypothetical protein